MKTRRNRVAVVVGAAAVFPGMLTGAAMLAGGITAPALIGLALTGLMLAISCALRISTSRRQNQPPRSPATQADNPQPTVSVEEAFKV